MGRRMQLRIANVVNGFGKIRKETKAVKIKKLLGVLHSFKKRQSTHKSEPKLSHKIPESNRAKINRNLQSSWESSWKKAGNIRFHQKVESLGSIPAYSRKRPVNHDLYCLDYQVQNEPFLIRIITSDKNSVTYRNVKTVYRLFKPSVLTSRSERYPKCLLLCVWWTMQVIIHQEVLPLNGAINAAFCCLHLDRLRFTMVAKRSSVVNWCGVIILYARFHVISIIKFVGRFDILLPILLTWHRMTILRLMHFTALSTNVKTLSTMSSMMWKLTSRFFNSRPQNFYRRGIHLLPDRWQEVSDSNDEYA